MSRPYGKFFSTLLYLTIGPLFAIPRCASTSFAVALIHPVNRISSVVPAAAASVLPFFSIGLGWVCPAVIGFVTGLLLSGKKRDRHPKTEI